MTWSQFNAALERLGYSQVEFAKLIGVSDRMVRNWAAGKWPVPVQTALLLKLMDDISTKEWKKLAKKKSQTK